MNRRLRPAIVAAVVAAALGVLVAAFVARSATPARSTTPLGGRAAPAIAGANLAGGHVSLASMRGRYVIVDFFASWCGTCVAEEPQIEAFAFAHRHDHGVGLLGVDIGDSPGNARRFFATYGATWPAVVDTTGAIAQSYGVASPPELFLVDPRGRVVSTIADQVTAAELSNWVRTARAAGA